MVTRRHHSLIALIFLFAPLAAPAVEWDGKCVGVSDGDTITVMYHELPLKIRLYGIDAPERGQDFDNRAKQHLAGLVHGNTVHVQFIEFDHYNRAVGLVSVDGLAVNREMVSAGYAWVFTKYCKDPHLSEWLAEQDKARLDRRGLWSHANPVAPADYRAGKRRR